MPALRLKEDRPAVLVLRDLGNIVKGLGWHMRSLGWWLSHLRRAVRSSLIHTQTGF